MSPLGLVLLALCWSGAVWAGASLICRMGPAPKRAQAIWRGAGLALLAPFAASLFLPGLPAMMDAPLADLPMLEPLAVTPNAGAAAPAAAKALELPETGTLILAVVAAGWAVRFLLWTISQVRLQRIKMRAMRSRRPIGHWAEAVGLARAPRVHVIPRGAPFLAGIFRRSVYVPSALIGGEGAVQVIVHELVHLKRGDLLTRPLERILADVFWFSPFAWWIRDQLDFWREAVVDEETAELTGDRIAYARTLTTAARVSRDEAVLPVAAFILRKKGNLKMRLNELLTEKTRPRRLGLATAAALACAAPLALAQGMLIKGAASGPGADVSYSHALLDHAKLTSTYGERPDPFTKKSAFHNGVDLAAPRNTPVYAPAAGTVLFAGEKQGYGNAVDLMVSDGTRLRYGQLETIAVKAGDVLKAGAEVGSVGTSGRATGPHLHFEVWHGENPADPLEEKGLLLADSLSITASAGIRMPAPPAPPIAPQAAEPVPAAGPVAPAAPVVPAVPAACETHNDFLAAPVMDADWVSRKQEAKAANKAAGFAPAEDWVPDTVSYPAPSYPVAAVKGMTSGACLVMFDLGTDGKPENVLAHCSDPVFEDSAAELPGARFEPARDAAGQPVKVKGVVYPLSFCIEG